MYSAVVLKLKRELEKKNRELAIESALEGVRAVAMAMKKPEDMLKICRGISKELVQLGLKEIRNIQTVIVNKEKADYLNYEFFRVQKKTLITSVAYKGHRDIHRFVRKILKDPEGFFSTSFVGEKLKEWTQFQAQSGQYVDPYQTKAKSLHYYFYSIGRGALGISTYAPLSKDEIALFKRFRNVFQLSYQRFSDIQAAEDHAREVEIQLSLERMRARGMSMHKTDELLNAAELVYKELSNLGINSMNVSYAFVDENGEYGSYYSINPVDGKIVPISFVFPHTETQVMQSILLSWKKQEPINVIELNEKATIKHQTYIGEHIKNQLAKNDIPFSVEEFLKVSPKKAVIYSFNFSQGYLFQIGEKRLTEAQEDIMLRSTRVFEQTYTRFLDLKKAEASTREAKIETALEKVRARAMAMQKSDELRELIVTVYSELTKLDLVLDRCFICIFDPLTNSSTWWMAAPETSSGVMGLFIKYHEAPPYLAHLQAWKERLVKWQYILEGNVKKEWDEFLFSETEFSLLPREIIQNMRGQQKVFLNASFNAFGCLTLATLETLTVEQFDVMVRFARVFDLTYTRFNDLTQAEAQAREANIEVALERVRARALAMQVPEELTDVAQVLRNEMGALGVEELETASIYIHEKDSDTAECWYALRDTANDSVRMVADQFQLSLDDTWVGREMKKFYLSDEKQTSIVMQGDNRKEWIEYCYKHSPVFSGYYGETIPDRTYHLYKFSHGYIGAAAPGNISAESWRLLSRAASVFSLAYSRFKDLTQARNDLQRLKEEKLRAESALKELRSTQAQLIQTEKMASLGELTAGIAHEIQNPLNFVNNFSEVSNELITEMIEELAKGNNVGAKELVDDVKQNLEKINLHGKRADAIVKSMLQHSRKSTGQKELTDINALVEEYLRLAYHGFRAKDQSFNAKSDTRLDKTLEKIQVVPQDLGRVILNLVNNAFYAVAEKNKVNLAGYEPMVTISTQKNNGNTEIKVVDNGNGMSPQIIEKIFQPFFTTKPTGQGTGLGLSLSYDIVTKGHGGELTVNTTEGEGSEFVIQLPG